MQKSCVVADVMTIYIDWQEVLALHQLLVDPAQKGCLADSSATYDGKALVVEPAHQRFDLVLAAVEHCQRHRP